MYAVIFKATINKLDDEYYLTAEQMRELAMTQYNCHEFNSVSEGDKEISISYWDSLEQITQWKSDPQHLIAQERGKNRWYRSYSVQVVEIIREYQK